jgi:hypothetical protein
VIFAHPAQTAEVMVLFQKMISVAR